MSNSYFRFKQFIVHHDRCAMKVGTDGVLLGAWVNVCGCDKILDVGTGSGLIALMIAQRNGAVQIKAIDIDLNSVLQARENVAQSPFAGRIDVQNVSFQDFVQQSADKFDLIVSNPPFFVDSLLPPDALRSKARHAQTLAIKELLTESKKIVSPNGKLALIYPFYKPQLLQAAIAESGWYIHKQTDVYPKSDSASPKRALLELSLQPTESEKDTLVIELHRHKYSDKFVDLVKGFYLKL